MNPTSQNHGDFHVEIGIKREDESFAHLDGAQRTRRRFIVVNGIVSKGERENRFQGFFIGSFFFLQLPINDRIVNIIGQVRIDSDNQEFTGIWGTSSTRLRGWIQGSFN